MCSDAPSPAGQIAMAQASEKVGMRQLDIMESLLPYYRQRQDDLDALTKRVNETTIGVQRQSADQAKDMFDYSVSTFRPVEQSVVAQAMADSMPDAYARYASGAAARTGQVFSGLQKATERSMRSMGVNPNSARFASANRAAEMDAAVRAGADFNDAYDRAENRGYARRLDAAGLGRNLAGASTAAYGAATGAGSAALSGANQASQTAASTIGTATQYGQLANQSFGNAIQAHNSVMQAPQGGLDPGLGALIGAGASYMMMGSDENIKEDIEPLDGDKALRGINRTKVKSWKYKDGAVPGDDETHVGAMAQDMRKNLGEDVAPGGKVINRLAAARANQAAIDALQREVEELESKLAAKSKGVKRKATA